MFAELGLTTPNQFDLKGDIMHAKIASKLVYFAAFKGTISNQHLKTLKKLLITFKKVMSKSQSKRLLVGAILRYNNNTIIASEDLMCIYSGIVHPRIKAINKKTIKQFIL